MKHHSTPLFKDYRGNLIGRTHPPNSVTGLNYLLIGQFMAYTDEYIRQTETYVIVNCRAAT